jgi:hypothetical protein
MHHYQIGRYRKSWTWGFSVTVVLASPRNCFPAIHFLPSDSTSRAAQHIHVSSIEEAGCHMLPLETSRIKAKMTLHRNTNSYQLHTPEEPSTRSPHKGTHQLFYVTPSILRALHNSFGFSLPLQVLSLVQCRARTALHAFASVFVSINNPTELCYSNLDTYSGSLISVIFDPRMSSSSSFAVVDAYLNLWIGPGRVSLCMCIRCCYRDPPDLDTLCTCMRCCRKPSDPEVPEDIDIAVGQEK